MSYLTYCYLYISFISCTCWVPTISVHNLAIFPYYSNLLFRRRRWIGILRRGVLGYVLPRLLFLWCYRVFRCSIPMRVVLVFRDIIHVIILLYSCHLVIYEHFWPYVWNNWFWVWQKWYQSCVNHRNASLVRRVLSLILFLVFMKVHCSNISPLLLIYKT
jgi:hypothetical protein